MLPTPIKNMSALKHLWDLTCAFNEIANKDTPLTKADMLSQMKVIEEEVKELREGIEQGDPVKILDGCVDALVTIFGMRQRLMNLGYDVTGAEFATANNNDTKFFDRERAGEVLKLTENKLGIKLALTYNEKHNRCAILDDAGKVRKPYYFVSNNLTEFTKGARVHG